MSRWYIAAAFVAGLLPGLVLYWANPRTVEKTVVAPSVPAAPGTAPAPAPAQAVDAKKPAERLIRKGDPPASDHRLAEENQTLQSRLSAAENALTEAQTKLRDVEARLTAAQEQHQQALQTQEREWRDQLQNAQRQLTTVEGNAKSREARLQELEAAQSRQQRQAAEASQRAQRLTELAGELEEIARRREAYLNTIIGRYREATDLFRALSLRLDNPRDAGSPLNNDLSRIQAAIQHADEDLRQLRALNAQSAKLQKELASRR